MASEKTNDSAGAGTRPPAREPRNAGISRDSTAKFAKGARWGGSSYCEQIYKYLTRGNARASLARGPATAGLRLCEHARPAVQLGSRNQCDGAAAFFRQSGT